MKKLHIPAVRAFAWGAFARLACATLALLGLASAPAQAVEPAADAAARGSAWFAPLPAAVQPAAGTGAAAPQPAPARSSATSAEVRAAVIELAERGRAIRLEHVRLAANDPETKAAAPTPTRAPGQFAIADNERLSAGLAGFLAARGWKLAWDAPQDYLVQHGYAIDVGAMPLREALQRILAPYALSAVIHDAPPNRVVRVISAGQGADR